MASKGCACNRIPNLPLFSVRKSLKVKFAESGDRGYILSERKHYARTEGALPLDLRLDIETAADLLEQAGIEFSNKGSVPDVKKNITEALSILRGLLRYQESGEKRSLFSLYVGVLLGGLIGVVGNFFVSFFFQGLTVWSVLGLTVSGIGLFLACGFLWVLARKYGP